MSTGVSNNPTFDEVFKRNVKRVLNHWTPFTVVLAFVGTIIGSLSLYAYAKAIGRPDLFMAAFDVKAYLAVWVLMVTALMFLQMLVLLGSSWFYGMAVSIFAKVGDRIRIVAIWLLIPPAVGYALLIWLGFYHGSSIGPLEAFSYVSAATLIAYSCLNFFKPFRRLVADASSGPRKTAKYELIVFTGVVLVISVWTSLLSIIMIIDTYVGADTKEATNFVAGFTLFVLIMNLMPAMLYFFVEGHVFRKAAAGVVGAILVFLIFLVTAQGSMSSITNVVAQSLDVRQRYSYRFVLEPPVLLSDLDPMQWQSHLRLDGKVQVRAFQLFAFGDLLLLCPDSFRTLKLYELPRFTPLCIFTRDSLAKRLPPKLAVVRNKTSDVGQAAWREMADCLAQGTKRPQSCDAPK